MKTIVTPNKSPGRVVVGPRQVQSGYARLIACEDGSGRIELYDPQTRSWSDASGKCTFSELWSGPPTAEPCSTETWLDRPRLAQPENRSQPADSDFDQSDDDDFDQPSDPDIGREAA